MTDFELKVLENLEKIISTCNLLNGFIMLCIALVALYILYKFINMLF